MKEGEGGDSEGVKEGRMDDERVLVVCIWLSVALFPLLLYSVLWVQGLFSISISLPLYLLPSLLCLALP